MTKRYRSDAMAAIHETMEALHEVEIGTSFTYCRFKPSLFLAPIIRDELFAV